MDPTPNQTERDPQSSPGADDATSADAEHWNPLKTERAKWSWGLLAIFGAIYFVIAVLTSEAAAELAATMIFGLPLGFYLGVAMIISGLVIVRFYLARIEV
ncbi:MAG: DUF485 domain-containing protein [Candidatus Limnocylindrales bacterium]